MVATYDRFPQEGAAGIAYHAQQVAEKVLKNVFSENDMDFKDVHDIPLLLEESQKQGLLSNVESMMDQGRYLSYFSGSGRYPNEMDVDKSMAMKAIADCKAFMHFIEENGYPSLDIPIEVGYLRDQPAPAKEVPEKTQSARTPEKDEAKAREQAEGARHDNQAHTKHR